MNMFVVTTGTYSDYRICGLYSTREKAEADTEAWIKCRIEEFPLDQALPPGKYWEIWMTAEGDILEGDIQQVNYSPTHEPISRCAGEGFLVHAFGSDEKHAAKVANELRIQWLKENS